MQNWKADRITCSKVISINEKVISDEDLLTLLLSSFRSTTNSRKIAMRLILQFETIGAAMAARSEQLLQVAEVDQETIAFLKAIGAAGARLAREEISHRSLLDAWDKLISYLRTTMAHQTVEQFRVLFLDRRTVLIRTRCSTRERSILRRSIPARSSNARF